MSSELSRRTMVKASLSAALAAGLGIPLGFRAAGAQSAPYAAPSASGGNTPSALPPGKAQACIVLFMEGGASHIDTWDPKPGRPTGGEFRAIGSAVPGIRVSEHLPLLARRAKKLAIVRSMTSKEGDHRRARHLMHTSYPPQSGVHHPAFGSYFARSRGIKELPQYIAVGGPGGDPGFLGGQWAPLFVPDPTKPLRDLVPPPEVGGQRWQDRIALWASLEDGFAAEHGGEYALGHKAIGEQAVRLIGSPKASVFDLRTVPAAQADPYGKSVFGSGCLMARRLVETGVPYVEVTQQGWDTHESNFRRVKQLSADLDRGMSALLDDLSAAGLLDTTLVVWVGDFGRSPDVNAQGGRDHWPRAFSLVLAGGGIRGGQVVGATDADGRDVAERPVTVPDLFRTLAHALRLNPDDSEVTPTGRPLRAVERGKPIVELI
jgi:hypothetical protein